jgi:hypothetical protein
MAIAFLCELCLQRDPVTKRVRIAIPRHQGLAPSPVLVSAVERPLPQWPLLPVPLPGGGGGGGGGGG